MGINRTIYLSNPQKFEGVKNLELLKINYLDFYLDLTPYDYLIFTSKNGVIALDKNVPNWKHKNSLAITKQTANTISLLGGNPFFIGTNGHGNNFAYEILDVVKEKKSLYIRPKEVANDLDKIFTAHNIDYDFLIAYDTVCNAYVTNEAFEKNSIFIFTSPKMVHCFMKNYTWDESFIAVCIGKTTEQALPRDIQFVTSDMQSIEACVALAKSIL